MTDHTSELWTLTVSLDRFPLAKAILDTQSLDEAATIIGKYAPNELEYETAKARSFADGAPFEPGSIESLESDRAVGATHVTLRRVRELTGSDAPAVQSGAITLSSTPSGLFRLADK